MSTEITIRDAVETAAETVGSVWPLHSFVTANPLAGFEDQPFHEAVEDAEEVLGGDGYPSADLFEQALADGRIDPEILSRELAEAGYELGPEASLDRLETDQSAVSTDSADDGETTATDRVDAVLTKWLSAFLDQGTADWAMPNREDGFYEAFCSVAPYDDDVPTVTGSEDLPDRPAEAIRECLTDQPVGRWHDCFEFHLSALPGWTGYVKQRATDGGAWQSRYPITLTGYLAVRLTLVDAFDAPLGPPELADGDAESVGDGQNSPDDERVPLPEVWLSAWEATYRSELVESLSEASASIGDGSSDSSTAGPATDSSTAGPATDSSAAGPTGTTSPDGDRPDAQLVFCIDTRSEIVRRHVEAAGDYETHGYAGFFGVPMRHSGYGEDVTVDACPPILDAQHRITDRPARERDATRAEYDRWQRVREAGETAVERLQSNVATAFSFVESTGVGYAGALAARTLLPARVFDLFDEAEGRVPDDHEFCEPSVDYNPDSVHSLREGLTHDEKVEYAATAFELMGWEQFARLVVFTGHASQTANNPFDSSLDCGACAGNPGGPNARVLAAICNDEAVKSTLRDRGIDVPEDTVFLAGEHNTTTDEIELFDGHVPESHEADLERLRTDLEAARSGAAAERAEDMGADADSGVRETERRAADWAETRPEWGLAGNAGFVIGPRTLTEDLDLDGRSFLHSYDWRTDPDGNALDAILAGPMVVTQWINTQYYFATVDNATYGSGSKITQNPVGNVGVYQGNGGDLQTGLPLQSVMAGDDEPYHQPLRLSTVVHAPVERVERVLADHDEVTELLDNDWLSLTVVDPTQDHRAFHYERDLTWTAIDERVADVATEEPSALADD